MVDHCNTDTFFRHRLLKSITTAGLLMAGTTAWAGAWVPAEGDGYNKFAVAPYNAKDFFGDNPDFKEFTGINYSIYAEHGLGNNVALYGTLLYQDLKQTTQENVTTRGSGFGDVELGVRYQFLTDPVVLSTAFLVKLPWLYDRDAELPLGNGQVDYESRLLLGKSLNQFGYIGVEVGYRYRTGDPSDEIRYLFEYGFNATDNLYFRTKLDGTKSVGNSQPFDSAASPNLSATPEFDLGKLEVTGGWSFGKPDSNQSRWGLEMTWNKDLYGRNTLDGMGFQIGLTRVY
ncbi:Uncharacterised protein [BD1-7 clade bacterium]|uniref:Outer membrane protein beta-barrel domain-containing protein n=1 Tax=BD1-7 clade bacterium TaxID=2029982 RepID=A0A5S9QCL0_9GAMM|nr:Uncharacterised protein [BD1-7 clade bacterium]